MTTTSLNTLEQQLLHAEISDAEPRLCIRSQTRVDTGRWWRPSPVWLCVAEGDLIMFAVARRKYIARISLRDIHASRYHHATGELVIEPGKGLLHDRFRLPLQDAISILNLINQATDARQPHPISC
jgi:hypothetical protein